MFAALEGVTAKAQKKARDRDSGQMSLFSLVPEDAQAQARGSGIGFDCPEGAMPEWDHEIYSRSEKEALGFYLSSHPLQPYRKEMIRQQITPLEECRELAPDDSFKCAVLAQVDKLRMDAKNRRWALLRVEDLTASGVAFCFSDAYEQFKDLLAPDVPLYMEGRICRPREEDRVETPEGEDAPLKEIKFIVTNIMPLAESCAAVSEPVCIDMQCSDDVGERMEELKEVLGRHKGQVPVHLVLHLGEAWCRMELSPAWAVTPGPYLEQDLGLWARAD
jgi:DNA polymerase-3 subunit alpha